MASREYHNSNILFCTFLMLLSPIIAQDIHFVDVEDKVYDDSPVLRTLKTFTISNEITDISASVTWKDQGWGNQKGRIYLKVTRGGTQIARKSIFPVAPHAWTTTNRGKINCNFDIVFQQNDKMVLEAYIGSGGGHEIYIRKLTFDVTYGPSGCPTESPTTMPTGKPIITENPTGPPSEHPTKYPSKYPTTTPKHPTFVPSQPSFLPTSASRNPSQSPSISISPTNIRTLRLNQQYIQAYIHTTKPTVYPTASNRDGQAHDTYTSTNAPGGWSIEGGDDDGADNWYWLISIVFSIALCFSCVVIAFIFYKLKNERNLYEQDMKTVKVKHINVANKRKDIEFDGLEGVQIINPGVNEIKNQNENIKDKDVIQQINETHGHDDMDIVISGKDNTTGNDYNTKGNDDDMHIIKAINKTADNDNDNELLQQVNKITI